MALEIATTRPIAPCPNNLIPAVLLQDLLVAKKQQLGRGRLRLRGFYIDGDLDLSFINWRGELALIDCYLNGSLILDHARVTGEISFDGTRVERFRARSAVIDGSLSMSDGFSAEHGVYAIGITVKNSLSMRHCRIVGPKDVYNRMAVELFRADVGDLFIHHSKFDGGVYAAGITVRRNVRLQGSSFRSRTDMGWPHRGPDFNGALTLSGGEVKGSIYMSTASTRGELVAHGPISLSSASCRQLFIHSEVLNDCVLNIDGLTYSRLRGTNTAELLRWLDKCEKIQPLAYVQLAEYCQSIGELLGKKRVLIALEKRVTRKLPIFSASRAIRGLHETIVGYGYQTSRAIPWLIGTVLLAAWIVHSGRQFFFQKPTALPAGSHSVVPGWNESFGITIDNFPSVRSDGR